MQKSPREGVEDPSERSLLVSDTRGMENARVSRLIEPIQPCDDLTAERLGDVEAEAMLANGDIGDGHDAISDGLG